MCVEYSEQCLATECHCQQHCSYSLESEEGGLDQGTTEASLMNYGLSQFIENHWSDWQGGPVGKHICWRSLMT